ncbi:hypothetical protein LEN26_012755 [Aphanomyces euteiches]|nr:hypothetical protein LEN26_012755 [Aphanomyces euteiches]
MILLSWIVLVYMKRHITLPALILEAHGGDLALLSVNCWIDERDRGANITLGRRIMNTWGYDTAVLLEMARKKLSTWDMSLLSVLDNDEPSACKLAVQKLAFPPPDDNEEFSDDNDPSDILSAQSKIDSILEERTREAEASGISKSGAKYLRNLLFEFIDVLRIEFANDPPLRIEQLQVRLEDGARPTKCKARRYSPLRMEYLRKHLRDLESHELIYKNNRPRWASPPRVVPKKNGDLRRIVDMRAVNTLTEPMHWPMPVVEVVMSRLQGKYVCFACDWFKGYWQLALHEKSQELFTIMGVDDMKSSSRVLIGHIDAVAYCQYCAQTVYGDRYGNGLEAWLDNVTGSATSEVDLMDLLNYLLQ